MHSLINFSLLPRRRIESKYGEWFVVETYGNGLNPSNIYFYHPMLNVILPASTVVWNRATKPGFNICISKIVNIFAR